MTNQKPTLSLEEFADLLGQLDRFIGAHNPELNLEVRAIGGFSLMYHDKQTSLVLLRKGSSDIDTLTHLPQSVATMVDIIATNNDVNSDWLNDCQPQLRGRIRALYYLGADGVHLQAHRLESGQPQRHPAHEAAGGLRRVGIRRLSR